jgi:hypothetical protein
MGFSVFCHGSKTHEIPMQGIYGQVCPILPRSAKGLGFSFFLGLKFGQNLAFQHMKGSQAIGNNVSLGPSRHFLKVLQALEGNVVQPHTDLALTLSFSGLSELGLS